MSELIPSALLYGQAVELLQQLQDAHHEGAIKDTFDLIAQLSDVLTRFQEGAGKPLLAYESVAETEPPSSAKANRFWRAAERDINLLQQQVDVLRASVIFSHNIVSSELMSARNNNARIKNKMKSLQLYSNSFDSNVITFGDHFDSFEFVDTSMVPGEDRAALFSEGHVTLGQQGEMVNLSEDADISILGTSNGFLGNNQEIEDPGNAPPGFVGTNDYIFKAQQRDYADIDHITDEMPNTWIEYERYYLTNAHKNSVSNFNFTYLTTDDEEGSQEVDWATPPDNNVLRLGLGFDFKRIRNLNAIKFIPYGLEENANYPVMIEKIQTSPNGTDWNIVYPTQVWVGNDINLRAARKTDNMIAHSAFWAFRARAVRFVRVFFRQPSPIDVNVGHIYWVDRRNESRIVEGPIPPIDNPTRFYDQDVVGELVQRRQYFPGKRWAIGIRDLLMQQVEYQTMSSLVTKPLRVGGSIDRVMLEKAEVEIPDDYPVDYNWVRFFISPDEGENWYPIAKIEDTYQDIPEQISFNDPLHESLREGRVWNYNLDNSVTSIRMKVELERPSDMKSTTPILKSYTLKVRRR